MTEQFDPDVFIRTMLSRGWHWSETDLNLLVHPSDHDLCIHQDPDTGRVTVSPRLDECLQLVIPTPSSKGRFWR